jgi:hypothetical protein
LHDVTRELTEHAAAASRRPRRGPLLAALIGCALVSGIVVGVLALLGEFDSEKRRSSVFPEKPVASSVDGLKAFATAIGHPVYWAGPLEPYTYELRSTNQGRVYVRYLPKGVSVGDRRAAFLTVATYPVANAVVKLRRAAAKGGIGLKTADGGFAYYDPARPTNVYYARRRSPSYEVEVFDPSPKRAQSFVLRGMIRPIG